MLKDIDQIVNQGLKYAKSKKIVWKGDQQTFRGLWFKKFRNPKEHQQWVPAAGELHGGIHAQDGVFQLSWEGQLENLLLRCGFKAITKKLQTKYHSLRQHAVHLSPAGGLDWLQSWAGDLINNPRELLI